MKKLFAITPLLFAALLAHADLVVEQKLESAMMNGNMTYKIKGDLARMDMPTGPAGAMSTVINTGTGDVTTLIHSQKMAMKMNLKDVKAQMEAMQKSAGLDKSKAQPPKPTGEKAKVGQWDTEVYTADAGGMKMKIWAARDYPNADAIKGQLNKVVEATSGGVFDPKVYDVPGLIVKTEAEGPQGKVTTTLVDVKEQPVAESEFQVPSDYKEMKMPGAPAAK
ncbi:DUF4412 domain-containing protein [Verrucomicrobiota bacterium sgz303538]